MRRDTVESSLTDLGKKQIDIVHGNVLDTNIDDATAAFVYLVPAGMAALKDALLGILKRGARVVTYGECWSTRGCLFRAIFKH